MEKGIDLCVIGLGYVGLPLVLEFAQAGFRVTGFDVDPHKINLLNQGKSYIDDVEDRLISHSASSFKITFLASLDTDLHFDYIIICVPTPLDTMGKPDLSFIKNAAKSIKSLLSNKVVVVLESTTYPGTTEELLQTTLEAGGKNLGNDFLLGYASERINPGDKTYNYQDIPKVISGVDHESTQKIEKLYQYINKTVVIASTPKHAEMSKLLENTFRQINIAFINEFMQVCKLLNLDVWEIIRCAETKPYGFMKFNPGIGVGGHCIPIDPIYLSFISEKQADYKFKFIELANEINNSMPKYTVDAIRCALLQKDVELSKSKILLLGMTYKKNTSDIRESPAIKVANNLVKEGATCSFIDPYLNSLESSEFSLRALDFSGISYDWDLIVMLQAHNIFLDWKLDQLNNFIDFTGTYV